MTAVQTRSAMQTLESALRESDGGHLPKGWPDKYEPVIGAVLAELEPGELVQRAWRMRSSVRHASDLGLLLVTDRRVLGAHQSSKDSGRFALAASDVATVVLVRLGVESSGDFITLGWKISLRGEDGTTLGGEDSPAEFQVFTRGKDPSRWDVHVRGEEELKEVQGSLVELLPVARASTDKSTTAPSSECNLTLSDTRVQPGGELSVTCSVRPWPNEKLKGIELELGYDTEVGSMKDVSSSLFYSKYEMQFNKRHKRVSELRIALDELEPTGICAATLVVPPEEPPSSLGCRTTSWSVVGRFARRGFLASDHVASSAIEVGPLTAEQIQSARPADWGPVGPSWLPPPEGRSIDWTEPQDLSISLDTPATARGDVLRGKLVFKLDPLGFAERGSYWTEGGKRKELAKADVPEVEMNDGVLTLECWRCCPPPPSYAVGSNHLLLFTQDMTVSLPSRLEVGKVHEFPFAVAIPGTFLFENGTGAPASPTWYARRESGIAVEEEDFVWRLSAIVRTSPKQLPLRAATEVLIT